MSSQLPSTFDEAALCAKTIKVDSNQTKLDLYALFKYVNNGNPDPSQRPSAFNQLGRMKFDTWAKVAAELSSSKDGKVSQS